MSFRKGDQVASITSGSKYTVVYDDPELDRVWVVQGGDTHLVLRRGNLKKYVPEIKVGDIVFRKNFASLTDARYAYRVIAVVPGWPNTFVAEYAKTPSYTEATVPFVLNVDDRDEWKIA